VPESFQSFQTNIKKTV